ncbi:Serine protease easter, partial [Armadillidium nasatum]
MGLSVLIWEIIFPINFFNILPQLTDKTNLSNEIVDSVASCGQKVSSDSVDGIFTNSGGNPWVALIGYEKWSGKNVYDCTGTLLNSHYVLTTATCLSVEHSLQVSFLTHVRLGEYNILEDPDCVMVGNNPCLFRTRSLDVDIENIVHHPQYNEDGFQSYNIGLIKLEQEIDFEFYDGFITPICLPPPGIDPKILLQDKLGKVVGWDFGSGHPNNVLMKEFLLLANDDDCEMWYAGFITEKQ